MIKFLDLYSQYLSIRSEIDGAIESTIRDSAYIGGTALADFEREFADYQQARHCVGVGNGTDAIEIALEALKLPTGAEVIVPANSFIASSEAVTRAGYRVVFADVDADTFTLDLRDARRRIGPRTAAVMAVHLYGCPCDMKGLIAMAREHRLKVLEDCAQAHGAEYEGRRMGALGDVGTFSFYPGKNLGAYGDGGAIVTNDDALAKRCRMIANHGRIDKYNHEFEGRNSRLDGLQAAILSVKLKRLDEWVSRRNRIARLYLDGLSDVPEIVLPVIPSNAVHAFHLFVIRTERRNELAAHLAAAEIQTGIHYPIALPKLAAYVYLDQANEPMLANRQCDSLLSLPMGEHLDDSDVQRVTEVIRGFFHAAPPH